MRHCLSLGSRPALLLAVLVACAASLPRLSNAAPRSVHPALSHIVPGEAISERFLARDRNGGVLAELILEGDFSSDILRAKGIEVNTRTSRFATARCPLALLPDLLSVPGIERVEISDRCKPSLDQSAPDIRVDSVRTVTPPTFTGQTGSGVLVGTVDTGIDYTHADFRRADGTTRLIAIWDQTSTAAPPPTGFTYGAEWSPAAIDAASATEVDLEGHGSHVMGIAAGDGSATGNGQPAYTYVGVAPEADLCVVKTTFSTANIVDGVSYIFQKAAARGEQAVVNLSLGTQFGPHDGTYAMDGMINQLTGPGKIVVASAGNSGEDNMHGQCTLSPGAPQSMTLTVPTYTKNPGAGNDYLIFSGWYEGPDRISLTITSPTGITLGPVATGSDLLAQNTADGYLNINNGTTAPSNGDNEIYIEIFDQFSRNTPEPGTWTFTFTPVSLASTGRVDMYLAVSNLGNGSASASWAQGAAFGGCVGSPGDADSVICVAAHTTKDCWTAVDGKTYCWNPRPTLGDIASFSSQGPRRDGVLKPDISAPGFGVTSALSSGSTASTPLIAKDGMHVNMAGTSMASPHVTGAAALLLAQPDWQNSYPSAVRSRLESSARSDVYASGLPNPVWGYGKLDVAGALAPTLVLLVPHPAKGEYIPPGKPDSVTVAVTGLPVDSVTVDLSIDGGATYPIALGTLTGVSPGPPVSLAFFVDVSMMTTQAKVRAVAYQGGAATRTSYTDSLFLIAAPSAVETAATTPPVRFWLDANAPNPFNPVTTIRFEVDRAGPATLRIYSVRGELVRTLVDAPLSAGRYRAQWDGKDGGGRAVGSGVYVYELASMGRHITRKMSLLK